MSIATPSTPSAPPADGSNASVTSPAPVTLKPVPCSRCQCERVWGDASGNWWCENCNPSDKPRQVRRKLELRTFSENGEQRLGWLELQLEARFISAAELTPSKPIVERVAALEKQSLAQTAIDDWKRLIPPDSTYRGCLWHLYLAHQVHGDEFSADFAIEIFDGGSEILTRDDLESLVRELDLSKVGDRTARSILFLTKGWKADGAKQETLAKREVLLIRLLERVSRGPGGDKKAAKFMRPLM